MTNKVIIKRSWLNHTDERTGETRQYFHVELANLDERSKEGLRKIEKRLKPGEKSIITDLTENQSLKVIQNVEKYLRKHGIEYEEQF